MIGFGFVRFTGHGLPHVKLLLIAAWNALIWAMWAFGAAAGAIEAWKVLG